MKGDASARIGGHHTEPARSHQQEQSGALLLLDKLAWGSLIAVTGVGIYRWCEEMHSYVTDPVAICFWCLVLLLVLAGRVRIQF